MIRAFIDDKQTFKICEAVALGLTHYYMGPRDKRKVSASERAEAQRIIPTLPKGWMIHADKLPWSCMNKKSKNDIKSKKKDS